MSATQNAHGMSPGLLKVADRAKREPKAQFHSLAHLIDVSALERAYARARGDAAAGVDGVTKEMYGQNLRAKLQELHGRMKEKKYRHQPIRRAHIPKDKGGTRPIGISAFEDKLVQSAISEVLGAIYEQDFLNCSYGFRPERNCHDAIRSLDREVHGGEVSCILEADVRSFFDSVNRSTLEEMLRVRVTDTSLLRLIGKCLHVGVLDGEEFSKPEEGTVQGSALSPMLGNIYLHYALDLWFERVVKRRLRGRARLIRYADDFIITFERREDAERVMAVLAQRMEKFGLTLHPDKTRILDFRRPPRSQTRGKGPSTFDFLGFTCYWRRTRSGRWEMACKTRRARLTRAINRIHDFCRRHRHSSVKDQHAALVRRVRGHFNYFGINGNTRSLETLRYWVERVWFKWLCRRSQRTRRTWERFRDMLRDFPLPQPKVYVQIWG